MTPVVPPRPVVRPPVVASPPLLPGIGSLERWLALCA
jgi:hypothetical protein